MGVRASHTLISVIERKYLWHIGRVALLRSQWWVFNLWRSGDVATQAPSGRTMNLMYVAFQISSPLLQRGEIWQTWSGLMLNKQLNEMFHKDICTFLVATHHGRSWRVHATVVVVSLVKYPSLLIGFDASLADEETFAGRLQCKWAEATFHQVHFKWHLQT